MVSKVNQSIIFEELMHKAEIIPKFANNNHINLVIMKKIVIFIVLIILSITVFAQNKGDKYIAPCLSVAYGNQSYSSYLFNTTNYSRVRPCDFSLNPGCEFGYFPINDFRLGIAVGLPFSAFPAFSYNDNWEIDYALGVSVKPNIAYYVRLADRLYYTPEIGFRYELWNWFDYIGSILEFENGLYQTISVYANLFDLEFRVNEKLAIGVGLGSLYYSRAKSLWDHHSNSLWNFSFTNSSVSVRFYL